MYWSNRKVSHLNYEQKNDLCEIELLEVELFDHLTLCEQMIFNWTVNDTLPYLETYNRVQTNVEKNHEVS